MKDIIEYKVIILDNEGNCGLYSKGRTMDSTSCVRDYAKTHGKKTNSIQNYVKKGKIVFTINDNYVKVEMPDSINDSQLYHLDLLTTKMDGIKYMKVTKGENENFILTDRIDERFSNEVIQSFLDKSKQKNFNHFN